MSGRIAIALVLLCFLGAPALGLGLPVASIYGSGDGCRLYGQEGMDAIAAAGGTEEFDTDDEEDVILTPTRMAGGDWVCRASTVDGEAAALLCVTDGATWTPLPVVHFTINGDDISFEMDEERYRLRKCG